MEPAQIAAAIVVPAVWSVTRDVQPFTHNDEMRAHRMRAASHTKEWRVAFARLARQHGHPPPPTFDGPVVIVVDVERPNRRSMPDVAASAGAAKAAIDGLVTAHVFPDDSPVHVGAVVFPAARVTGRHALTLHVHTAAVG